MNKPADKKRLFHWSDNPQGGHYIDDNALFLLIEIVGGRFSSKESSSNARIFKLPIGWTNLDLIFFVLKVSKCYGFFLTDFSVNVSAFSEEYELDLIDHDTKKPLPEYVDEFEDYFNNNQKYEACLAKYHEGEVEFFDCLKHYVIPPKYFKGAYKWAIEESAKRTKRGELMKNIFDDYKGLLDREGFDEIIRMYQLIAPEQGDSNESYQKQIAKSILEWTNFVIEIPPEVSQKMKEDLFSYITKFMKGELVTADRHRTIAGETVLMSQTVYSYKKHLEILHEILSSMEHNYGKEFTIKNPFDAGYIEGVTSVNDRYLKREFLFFHSIFALHCLNEIKILNLGSDWHFSEIEPTRATADVLILNLSKSEPIPQKVSRKWQFDERRKVLKLDELEIDVSRAQMQYQTLSIVGSFFDKTLRDGEEIDLVDIANEYDSSDSRNTKPFLNALYQINQKILKKNRPCLFQLATTTVRLTDDYLS